MASNAPDVRSIEGQWTSPIQSRISMLGPKKFVFLNKTVDFDAAIDWNDPTLEKLWIYNLHYFADLNAIDSNNRKNWHFDFLKSWLRENPIGLGAAWEPYPISLRVVNLLKWHFKGNKLTKEIQRSLAQQIRYLNNNLEFHLLGNHLLANAKALIYVGCYFTGSEALQWLKKALKYIQVSFKFRCFVMVDIMKEALCTTQLFLKMFLI